MAENKEFISAADLPVTEGNEVSVLCVENGELKQKPANGLGGSAPYFLRLNAEEFVFNEETGINMTDANYDELAKALELGNPAYLVINDPNLPAPVVCLAMSWIYMEGMLMVFVMNGMDFARIAFTNGSYIPDVG